MRCTGRCIVSRLPRFRQDASGLALIEFAIVLPVLLLMYLAGYQLSDAIACNRRVTIATRTAADLTSQVKCLNPGDMTAILGASGLALAPYSASNAVIRVSEIDTDAKGNSTVGWSQATDGSSLTSGSSYTLPGSIKSNGSSLVMSQVIYAYSPAVNFRIVGKMKLADVLYMSPRKSDTVVSTGCSS